MMYRIDKETSGRLDALKVLMTVFVLLIHAFSNDFWGLELGAGAFAYQITFAVSRVLCDCAVPMFMLISSILLFSKPIDWWSNVKKKCRSLLVPYLIFNSLWLVLVFCKHVLGKKLGITAGDDIDLASYSLFDWLDAYLGLTGDYKPLLTSLWYVRDLFILNLLAVPIGKLVDRLPIPMAILTAVGWLFNIDIPGIQGYSLPFFVLGCYFVKYQIRFRDLDRWLDMRLVTAVYLIATAVVVWLQREVGLVVRVYLLVAVVFWIRCSAAPVRQGIVYRKLSQASFFIYLTHRFFYAIIQVAQDGSLTWYLIAYLAKPLVALSGALVIYALLERSLPCVLAVMVGGRVKGYTPRRDGRWRTR